VANVCTLAAQTKGLPDLQEMEPFLRRHAIARRRRGIPPPLVLHGSNDEVLGVSCTTAVARRLGGPAKPEAVTVTHIPGATHSFEEKRSRLTSLVLRWVLQHSSPAPPPTAVPRVRPASIGAHARNSSQPKHDIVTLVSAALPDSPVLSPPRRSRLLQMPMTDTGLSANPLQVSVRQEHAQEHKVSAALPDSPVLSPPRRSRLLQMPMKDTGLSANPLQVSVRQDHAQEHKVVASA